MPATTAKRKPAAAKTTVDYLEEALKDLDKAREKAGEGARSSIESAVDRIREAAKDARSRGADQMSDWQKALEDAAEDARLELGKAAIHAQRSPEALTALSSEIRKCKAKLTV